MGTEETKKFFFVQTRKDVAALLGIEDRYLCYLLYKRKIDNCYTEYKISKKRGGSRTIDVPYPRLRNLQRKLLRILEDAYKVKPSAYGFIKKRGHIENAKNHLSRKVILNLDLKDFFHQIHFGRVRGLFMSKPYEFGEEAATVLAQLTCFNGVLPQGAPTSPIISNMICSSLDTKLIELAKKYRIVYTRYADDLTFSTFKNSFPRAIVYMQDDNIIIGDELKTIIEYNSFVINNDKVFIRGTNRRQEVTGLTVNNRYVNLPRNYLREIRSILYDCESNGIYESALRYISLGKTTNHKIISLAKTTTQDEEQENAKRKVIEDWYCKVVKGKIEYVKCVRGNECSYYKKYGSAYNKLIGVDVFKFDNSLIDIEAYKRKFCFIIEKDDPKKVGQGTGFLLKNYGILTNQHVVDDIDVFYDIKTVNGFRFKRITGKYDYIKRNAEIDYALIKAQGHEAEGWDFSETESISVGQKVRLLAFPKYANGDSITDISARITAEKKFLGQLIWTVDKNIVHGASGGIVINDFGKAVGIIVSGVEDYGDTGNELGSGVPGFIPIHRVINDIEQSSSMSK